MQQENQGGGNIKKKTFLIKDQRCLQVFGQRRKPISRLLCNKPLQNFLTRLKNYQLFLIKNISVLTFVFFTSHPFKNVKNKYFYALRIIGIAFGRQRKSKNVCLVTSVKTQQVKSYTAFKAAIFLQLGCIPRT